MLISQLKELQNNLDTLLKNDELLKNIENTIKLIPIVESKFLIKVE